MRIGSDHMLSFRRALHILIKFSNIISIMLALSLMLLVTYYALNYASIIGRGLLYVCVHLSVLVAEYAMHVCRNVDILTQI